MNFNDMKGKEWKNTIKWALPLALLAIGVILIIALGGGTNTEDVEIALPHETDWTVGRPDAPVKLVEYGDYQCAPCAAYHPILFSLAQRFENQLSITFRQYPLTEVHSAAVPAALAAEAAGMQGKFWHMHDLLYTRQAEWTGATNAIDAMQKYAAAIGLDVNRFTADMASPQVRERIRTQVESGVQLKITSTPTFYLNGEKIDPPRDSGAFQFMIEQAISEAGASSTSSDLSM